MEKKNASFFSIIGSIQKINLYETKSRLYLVGSNNVESRFRVLQIDRMEVKDLVIYDDKVEYSQEEIHDLVNRIEAGNRHTKTVSAFGIVGFVRFLEGYYIILITKRRKIAVVGYHTLYKIQHTSMIYIPNDTVRMIHPDEPRYLKMFQGIDLSSNFYFSYSYDITHTLQFNLTYPKELVPNSTSTTIHPRDILETPSIVLSDNTEGQKFGVRTNPQQKFVWNTHLLSQIEHVLHPDWILYITHGFIDQANVDVFGKSIYIVLIARRSCKYAGTRFLKRGANFQGDVANEVETEQIVYDAGVSIVNQGQFTSFVQMRGSVPGHWSQDIGKMVAKPPITIDLNEPYFETASLHFNELLQRYGAPIIILNLVKQREKRAHESLLSHELIQSVKYLNQFLPPEHHIVYKSFDMARKNKGKADVMAKLADKSRNAVMKTGFFHNKSRNCSLSKDFNQAFSLQTGIVRTNCVDCLDRTNTAQFAIGKCVLGYQLCALGILDSPKLEFDTDCVRMLENLYEDLGDTLALQYGGSFLVHRIKTYRKTAPWTSQGNDIMQTLSRYYNNTFSDAEKQNTMNLFLGLFIPRENRAPIWDYPNDYYLHHNYQIKDRTKPLTQWWDKEVYKCLPFSYNELTKTCSELIQVQTHDVEMIDGFTDFYRPDNLTVLIDTFSYTISNSIRDFMPNFTTNCSPFAIRVRPGRRREESSKNTNVKNPSLTGQSSTGSTASSDSSTSGMESSNEESSIQINESPLTASRECTPKVTFELLFPTMIETYGMEIKDPQWNDLLRYKKYVLIGKKANGSLRIDSELPTVKLIKAQSNFSSDTSERVEPPRVPKSAIDAYEKYVNIGKYGANTPNIEMYRKYVEIK